MIVIDYDTNPILYRTVCHSRHVGKTMVRKAKK